MGSISQNQSAALARGFLNGLGSSSAAEAAAIAAAMPAVVKAMALYGKAFLDEAIKNLNDAQKVATGEIVSALTLSAVKKDGGGYSMVVGYPAGSPAAEYYDYINKGVKGLNGGPADSPYSFKFLPPSANHVAAILNWLNVGGKTITATDVKKYGRIGNERKHNLQDDPAAQKKSIAFAIAYKQKMFGTKPTHFFDNAINSVFNAAFIEDISKAVGTDLRLIIRAYSGK